MDHGTRPNFTLPIIEFFRGRPRGPGGDNFTSLSKCSRPFIQSVKSTLFDHKSCNPVEGHPLKHRLNLNLFGITL